MFVVRNHEGQFMRYNTGKNGRAPKWTGDLAHARFYARKCDASNSVRYWEGYLFHKEAPCAMPTGGTLVKNTDNRGLYVDVVEVHYNLKVL